MVRLRFLQLARKSSRLPKSTADMEAKMRLRIKTTTVSSFAQNVMEASSQREASPLARAARLPTNRDYKNCFSHKSSENPHRIGLRKSGAAATIRPFRDSGRRRKDRFPVFQAKEHARKFLQSSFRGGHRRVARGRQSRPRRASQPDPVRLRRPDLPGQSQGGQPPGPALFPVGPRHSRRGGPGGAGDPGEVLPGGDARLRREKSARADHHHRRASRRPAAKGPSWSARSSRSRAPTACASSARTAWA